MTKTISIKDVKEVDNFLQIHGEWLIVKARAIRNRFNEVRCIVKFEIV